MTIDAGVVVTASASSNGQASSWIPLNTRANPFTVSFGLHNSFGNGTATVRVEHTFDNPANVTTVFVHEDVTAAVVASASPNTVDGNYAFPIKAIRFVVVSASGTSIPLMNVMQAGY